MNKKLLTLVKRNLSREAIRAHFILLFRFFLHFGFFHGIRLFFLFKTRRVQRLKLPGIRFPLKLRPATSDIQAFNHVFLDSHYCIHCIEKPKVIIDGGSNIGLFAIKMKNKYPDATILCIEPDTDNFNVLKDNLSAYQNIFIENCALWNKNSTGTLLDRYHLGKWGMSIEENTDKKDIMLVTLPFLLDKYHIGVIDVLKLDIETSEKHLFSDHFEDWLPRVRLLIIELHDWLEAGCASTFFKALEKSIPEFKYSVQGENTIVINTSLDALQNTSLQ